jgi:serine/threonine protein kinase
MQLVVHPKFLQLTDFLEQLPQVFPSEGKLIYKERNEIKTFDTAEGIFIVKSFRIPHFFNRLIYNYFRHSKARRSYEHAIILTQKNISTSQPVAYIEFFKSGLLAESYYIAQYKEYPGMMREFRYHPLAGSEELARTFAQFTAYIHEQNVLPLDYSPGNILYEKTGDKYHFCLIDINRMRFTPVNMEMGCHSFRRLWGNEEFIAFTAREYARSRHFDEARCELLALQSYRHFWKRYTKKYKGFQPYAPES